MKDGGGMNLIGLACCLVAALCWGAAGIFDKLGTKGMDPFVAVLIRTTCVTVVALVFCMLTGRMQEISVTPGRAYLFLALSGLVGAFLGHAVYYLAIKQAPVSLVVPITAAYPVITFILAVFVLREHFSLLRLGGVLLVVMGVWLVALSNPKNEAVAQPVGEKQSAQIFHSSD